MFSARKTFLNFAKCSVICGGKSGCWNASMYHGSRVPSERDMSFDWYKEVIPVMNMLAEELNGLDVIDGILVNVADDSVVIDGSIQEKVHKYKALARVFIDCSLVQTRFRDKMKSMSADAKRFSVVPFSSTSEREGMVISSLTQVCGFLNISSHKKQGIRSKLCQQVTQHRIWVGAIEEILIGLRLEMNSLGNEKNTNGMKMAEQIINSCLKYLVDNDQLAQELGASSWMRLVAADVDDPCCTWEEIYEMFNDLVKTLGREKALFYHTDKLKAMKEGLYQVKDVIFGKGMGYKEVRFQESLLSKNLTKSLGHPSPCLFTLLLYYLYGHVRDPEIDLCGKLYGTSGGESYMVCMGKILISDEEKMVRTVIKQLNRALGIFQLIWQLGNMQEPLIVEGHLWCLGARERTISYRDNLFFVHEIGL